MSKQLKSKNKKRTEKVYMLSLKLLIVKEIEAGKLSVTEAKSKYGIQDKSTITNWLLEFGSL